MELEASATQLVSSPGRFKKHNKINDVPLRPSACNTNRSLAAADSDATALPGAEKQARPCGAGPDL